MITEKLTKFLSELMEIYYPQDKRQLSRSVKGRKKKLKIASTIEQKFFSLHIW